MQDVSRRRAFHDKFIVETRDMSASTRRSLFVWAASLGTVGIVGFLAIAVTVITQGGIPPLDDAFSRQLDPFRSDAMTAVMIALAIGFGPIVLPLVVLVVIVAWGYFARHLWRPLLLAGGMLTGLIIVQVVTRLVARIRPPVDGMLFGPDTTFSFPSGHVLGAANFLLLIAFLVFSRKEHPRTAALSYTVAAGLILIAAISRIYLGYHWASDALASMLLSLAILGAVIAIDTHRTTRVKT